MESSNTCPYIVCQAFSNAKLKQTGGMCVVVKVDMKQYHVEVQ